MTQRAAGSVFRAMKATKTTVILPPQGAARSIVCQLLACLLVAGAGCAHTPRASSVVTPGGQSNHTSAAQANTQPTEPKITGVVGKPTPGPPNTIRIVSHVEPPAAPTAAAEIPEPLTPPPATYPIDLPTALQLADAHNLQIQFARERSMPPLPAGSGESSGCPTYQLGRWNRHDGQLQDTRGEVFAVSKSSLYAGGGPVMQFALAEAHFAPLAARQLVAARQAGARGVANATQLDVALTYWDLVRAYSAQAIVQQTIDHSRQLDKLSQAYLRAEKLKEADSERVRAELRGRMQELDMNWEQVQVVSARLAQALRLDPFVTLQPTNRQAIPVDLLESDAADAELCGRTLQQARVGGEPRGSAPSRGPPGKIQSALAQHSTWLRRRRLRRGRTIFGDFGAVPILKLRPSGRSELGH